MGITWSKLNYCAQFVPSVSNLSQQLPCMRLTWVVFVPGFLHTNTALAFSRSIGMELDSAGSTVSTCTGTTSFKTCTNLKCTCTFIYLFVQFKSSVHGWLYAYTRAPLVWGSLRLAPITVTCTCIISQVTHNVRSTSEQIWTLFLLILVYTCTRLVG